MDLRLKKRIVGGLILLAAALIIIPLFFSHSVPSSELQLSADIPPRPAKPDNLALPIPPKEATVPGSASSSKAIATNYANNPSSSIVFEQLPPSSPYNNNNARPTPTISAPAPTSSAAPVSVVAPLAANNKNIPQKTTVPVNTGAVTSAPTTVKPAEAAPSPLDIAELEQNTTGLSTSTSTSKVVSASPSASTTSQSSATAHKKPVKTPSLQTNKTAVDKTKNVAPNPESWAVQLGSFSDKLNAENLTKKLQAEGFSAYTHTSKTSHGDLIRVLVGPELRRTDAENLLTKLQKQLNLQGMIVKGM